MIPTKTTTLQLHTMRRVSIIRQDEASECGLACLAMVANYYRFRTSLVELRRRFPISLKGVTLSELVQISSDLGFHSRAVRSEPADLIHMQIPAIIHWDLNHFVVLTAVKGSQAKLRFHISDPGEGDRIITYKEFTRRFTGVLIEIIPAQRFRKDKTAPRLKISQLWSNIIGIVPALTQIIILSILLQLIVLITPFYLQSAIDTAVPSEDRDLIYILAVGFGGLVIINALSTWLRSRLLLNAGSNLGYQIILNLFRRVMSLPLTWFEKRHVGDVISRFSSSQPINEILTRGLVKGIIDGGMAVSTLVVIVLYNTKLAAITTTALLTYVLIRWAYLAALKSSQMNMIAATAKESSIFIENIRGISSIKSAAVEDRRQSLWQNYKADAVNANLSLGRTTSNFEALSGIILGVEQVLFIFVAANLLISAKITVGMLFALQAYKTRFLEASIGLVETVIQWKLIGVHLDRISDIALSKPEIDEDLSVHHRPPLTGAIELSNIYFSYGLGERQVLKGINLSVKAGECVALVGASGSGKTTLMKIMLGLLLPSHGQVMVDGCTLSAYGVATFRRQVGVVSQEDTLYAGTLAENIAFFDPRIDLDWVIQCAEQAHVHVEISSMTMGYETLVGDMGSALSGGQKQRVVLARALYRRPRILFMDEASSNLDLNTENEVSIRLSTTGITQLIIAHRRETIQRADRLFGLVDGNVVQLSRINNGVAASYGQAHSESVK